MPTKGNKSIHLARQLEWFKNKVHDKTIRVGGLLVVITVEGYNTRLSIFSGLLYLAIRPYADTEWDKLPHFILTDDDDWNPAVLYHLNDDCFAWVGRLWRICLMNLVNIVSIKLSTSWISTHMILVSGC